MASKITIKRSTSSTPPTGLSFGEMAFVQGTGLTANQIYVGLSGGNPVWVGAQIGTTGSWTDNAAKTSLATQYAIDQECPICYEEIMTKSTAFITNCGHSFHKSCLSKYIETKWLSTTYISTARCPMCRCSLGHPEFDQRYRSSYFNCNHSNDNELDKLEDFWLTKDYKLPVFCSHGYNHYLGLNKNCFICKGYREKGDYYNEIN